MNAPMNRRSFLRGTGYMAGFAMLTLAGCSAEGGDKSTGSATTSASTPTSDSSTSSSAPAGSSSSSSAAESTAEEVVPSFGSGGVSTDTPKQGGTLRVGPWSEQPGLNPMYNSFDPNGVELYGPAMYDTLAVATPNAEVVPDLAQAIEPNDDFTVWTVTLRPGVQYHDGSPLNADAIVANWQAAQKAPLYAGNLANLDSVAATDDVTVVFTTKKPWPAFNAYLTSLFIVHPKMLDPEYKGDPIGSGPFVFRSWVPGSNLTVDKNPNYWRTDGPNLDSIVFTPITDTQQRENALRSGSVDMISVGSPIDDMPSLQNDTDFYYRDDRDSWSFVPSMAYWILNCAAGPTKDLRIRQALAYATDQQAYAKLAFHGLGSVSKGDDFVPATGPFRPDSPWSTTTGYPTAPDVEKAKSLVADYTAENGQPEIRVWVIPSAATVTAAQLAQSQWEAVGIKVTIEQLEAAKMIGSVLMGDFDTAFWTGGLATDPDQNRSIWDPANSAPVGSFSVKPDRLDDARITPLLEKGRESADPAERAAAYQEFSKLLAEDLPYIYMGFVVGGIVTRNTVQNWAGAKTEEGAPVWWHSRPFTNSWLS